MPGMITSVNSTSMCFPLLITSSASGALAVVVDIVAKTHELRHHIGAHQRVVLHHEDRLRAALDLRDERGVARLRLAERRRQIELDGRALSFFAVDLDVSAGLLDEAVDHAQSETRCRVRRPWS